MANEQNLLKGDDRHKLTVEEQTRGGIASGKARAKKKELKEMMQEWLNTEIGKDKNGKPLTGNDLMLQVAVKEMTKGNPKFWELIRDTSGQKPVERVIYAEIEQDVIDDIEAVVNGEKDGNKISDTDAI